MDVRQKHMTNIQQRLTYLRNRVEIAGSLNLTDIHIYAEDFFQALFNLLGYSFKNGNIDKQNCAYIDLIDESNKVAMQVTARNDNKKITDTILGFFENSEHPEYKDYSLKVLLISKRAKDYSTDFTFQGKYKFNHKEDVIDIERLTAIIKNQGRKDVKKIIEISKFLDDEIDLPRPKTESNEVETIMSLLEYLSYDENYKEFDGNYICDPEQKINSRFKDYADDFKEEFTDLFAIYCNTIPEVKKAFGLDGVRAQKISYFLNYNKMKFEKEIKNEILKSKAYQDMVLNGFSPDEANNILSKSWSTDLMKQFPNGQWRTINGAKVFINNGKVIAGLDNFNGMIDDFFKEKNKKESKPKILELTEGKKWNGKIYGNENSGYSIYVNNDKVKISKKDKEEYEKYLIDKERKKQKEAPDTEPKEFGDSGTVSGNYVYNPNTGNWVVNIDSVDWNLVDEKFVVKKKEDIPKLIKKEYGVDIKI